MLQLQLQREWFHFEQQQFSYSPKNASINVFTIKQFLQSGQNVHLTAVTECARDTDISAVATAATTAAVNAM